MRLKTKSFSPAPHFIIKCFLFESWVKPRAPTARREEAKVSGGSNCLTQAANWSIFTLVFWPNSDYCFPRNMLSSPLKLMYSSKNRTRINFDGVWKIRWKRILSLKCISREREEQAASFPRLSIKSSFYIFFFPTSFEEEKSWLSWKILTLWNDFKCRSSPITEIEYSKSCLMSRCELPTFCVRKSFLASQ